MWRVSIAEIEANGPFSRFPGIERDLLLLAGPALNSTSTTRPVTPRLASSASNFNGEAAVTLPPAGRTDPRFQR
ncbi:MAG: HutD family protein [Xanthomonadales bacterium]|nr:HutD family protein [Xanthomonadales bacterium]